MPELSLTITSPPDREDLVAEVWLDDEMFGEVELRLGVPVLEVYPRRDGKPWQIDCRNLLPVVERAVTRLSAPRKT